MLGHTQTQTSSKGKPSPGDKYKLNHCLLRMCQTEYKALLVLLNVDLPCSYYFVSAVGRKRT